MTMLSICGSQDFQTKCLHACSGGDPRTMGERSDTLAAHPLFLGPVSTLPGQLPRVQPWASHGGEGPGKLIGFMSTEPGADPLGPVTWSRTPPA